MIHYARPRDSDESKRKANERTLGSYRKDGPWVVEAFNSRGVWEWTHYGEKPMTKRAAKNMAKLCQRIQDDLDRKAGNGMAADVGRHLQRKAKRRAPVGDRSRPPGFNACPERP